jgi:Zn-dependent membrane protease YugP
MYGGYYYIDSSWFTLLMIALAISFYAQFKVSSAFNKYLKVPSSSNYTGSEIARIILDRNGLYDVRVEPRSKT